MLKPIPQENSENERSLPLKKKTGAGRFSQSKTLQKIAQTNINKDQGIVQIVSLKLYNFAQGGKWRNSEEKVGELIHGLKRAILSLERHRYRLIIEKNKKKKRKK